MALVVINVDREHLPKHTEDEYEEWVKYCVGDKTDIDIKNPLIELDMDAEVREFM